jgi:hypothetical protein
MKPLDPPLFSVCEIRAAAKEWRCDHCTALVRLLEGEFPRAAMDALVAHLRPGTNAIH